jgi:multiple antibiotic resistance protein
VFPLAIPSIAIPGAMMAAVMLTENNRFEFWQQAQTEIVLLAAASVLAGTKEYFTL